MRNINHTRLEPFISAARLATYNNFFRPNDQVELLGCYLWNKEVASSFFPLLQVLEITLRNAIHNEASNRLGTHWFDNLAVRPLQSLNQRQQQSQSRQVNILTTSVRNARTDIRRNLNLSGNTAVSADRIVAKVTFGFWTNLFGVAFEVNRNPRALWPALLRHVFPHAPRRHRSRSNFQNKLLEIKSFRNKAFHHEPVWNMGRPATIADSINRLLDMKNTIVEVLAWISQDSVELVNKAGYVGCIERVCSIEHLDYLRQPGNNDIPISRAKRELRGLMRQSRNTADITLRGKKVGQVTTGG